jgi:hypothetical protein
MLEFTTAEGYKIYIFDNAIPKDICEAWIPRFRKETNNYVGSNPRLSQEIHTLLNTYVHVPFPVKDHQGHVSFVCLDTPIYKHFDQIYGEETHKVVFYLNEVQNGGTEFVSGNDWITVEAHQGTVVIFDIRIEHKGQRDQSKEKKYVMGMRLIHDKKE